MGYQLSLCPELVKMSWDDIVEELESEAKLVETTRTWPEP
jgi:hypothetical protein